MRDELHHDLQDGETNGAMYGIARLDDALKHSHGWYVVLWRNKVRYARFFSDIKFAGRDAALQAAKDYRDEVASAQPLMTKTEYVSIVRKNNNSGTPGVCRTVAKSPRRNTTQHYWLAFWPKQDGSSGRAKFSITRYGEEKALALAIEAREIALRKLEVPHIMFDVQRQWMVAEQPRRDH